MQRIHERVHVVEQVFREIAGRISWHGARRVLVHLREIRVATQEDSRSVHPCNYTTEATRRVV